MPELTAEQLGRLLAAPRDKALQAEAADWCEEQGGYGDVPAQLRRGRLPADQRFRRAVNLLALCRYAPATFDKRFVSDMVARLMEGGLESPTVPQVALVWTLVRKYRRQVVRYIKQWESLVKYAYALIGELPPGHTRPLPKVESEPLWKWVGE